jgi:uncharacterized protein YggE
MLMLAALLTCFCCSASADLGKETRTITVTGDADVLVAPDEAVLRLKVQTRDEDLDDAIAESDRRVTRVFSALKKLGVKPKHIKTDYMHISPDFVWKEVRVRAYHTRKSIVVTLKDTDKLEVVLAGALEAGANGLDGVEFRSTELRKHRDRARLLAVQAAREKAQAMAGALGQKIGRPQSILEQPNSGRWGWWGRRDMVAQNVVQNVGPALGATGETVSAGQMRINVKVTVAFELQ